MTPWTPAELRSGRLVWLLEVTWAGSVYRFASRPVTMTDAAGRVLVFDAGAVPDALEERVEFMGPSSTPASIGFEGLVFPVDVAKMVARGHWLQLARAEVSQWVEGRTYEQRRVVLTGRVRQVTYGAESEPVGFSVQPDELDERATLPPADAVVSTGTWPDAAEAATGAIYPFVFGTPGLGLTGDLAATGGSPGLLVDLSNRYLLIAGHRVEATSVTIIGTDIGIAATFSVDHRQDGQGRTVATVTLDASSGSGKVHATTNGQYTVDWSGTAGGLAGGAGDVAEYLLAASGLDYDRGSWAALRSTLNAYALDFYADAPGGPYRLLEEAVLPLLPLSTTRGPRGIEPVLWRLDATPADAVMDLVDGENVERGGDVTEDDRRLANEFRISYAPRWSGEMARVLTLRGGAVGTDGTVVRSGPAVWSESVWGALVGEPIETRMVYRSGVAARILSARVRAWSQPVTRMSFVAVDPAVGTLRRGDVVTVTSADLWRTNQVALVESLSWSGDVVTVGVVIVSVIERDTIP